MIPDNNLSGYTVRELMDELATRPDVTVSSRRQENVTIALALVCAFLLGTYAGVLIAVQILR